jgi:predicted ATP-grasp superfamily ATP-dependent carboligase
MVKKEIQLPVIFKPVRGYEFSEKFKCKNFEINTLEEYDRYAELCLKEQQEVMVQEIVPGPDTNIFKCMTYINSKNEITGLFFYNKIRQNPPRFGVHRVSISAGQNPEVERLFKKILNHSNYKGFCTVEFKKDPRDGLLKFIEVNVRMPRMISISTAAGYNFPWIIYNDLVKDQQLSVNRYNENLYWIEINSDIYNTLFKRSEENFTLKDYIRPYLSKHKTFSIFKLTDPKPFFLHTAVLLRKTVTSRSNPAE